MFEVWEAQPQQGLNLSREESIAFINEPVQVSKISRGAKTVFGGCQVTFSNLETMSRIAFLSTFAVWFVKVVAVSVSNMPGTVPGLYVPDFMQPSAIAKEIAVGYLEQTYHTADAFNSDYWRYTFDMREPDLGYYAKDTPAGGATQVGELLRRSPITPFPGSFL